MSDSIDFAKPNVCPVCGAALSDAAGGLCPRCIMVEAAQPTDAPSAAHGSEPPPQAAVAAAFPQFEIIELIGRGGMGTVWKTRQPTLHRYVALKLLPASLTERDPAFAERFAREGQLLARLHHPNIVAVHDSGRAGEFFYLVMEFVDGVNLRQAMRASRFTPQQALAIVPKICDALQYAHDEGVLHRDIKPENILLDAKGRVKLVDFGIAKLIAQSEAMPAGVAAPVSPGGALTLGDSTLGTPNYMAPEQIEKPADVDNRADIYSLGVVFYELLTGELPLGKFAPPSERSAADPRLDGIVQQALEKERDRRQQSVGEMRTQVETIAGSPGGMQSQPGMDENPLTKPRFSRKAIVGACWAALGLLAAIWLRAIVGQPVGQWSSMTGPEKLGFVLTEALFIVGFLCTLGTTILGWIAVSQIRRSAGKLRGLGLAVFDGLCFPLLALDAVIGRAWVSVIGTLITHSTEASLSEGQRIDPNLANHITNQLQHSTVSLALLAAAITAVIVDFLIIRAVWHAVNRAPSDSSAVAPTAPRESASSPLAYVAMFFAVVSVIVTLIGLLAVASSGSFAALIGPNFLAALLAILVAIPARKTRLGKYALILGCGVTALWLLVVSRSGLVRRPSDSSEKGEVRYRVFEADSGLVEKVVPAETRKPGQMLVSELETPNRPPQIGSPVNMVSQTAEIGADALGKLMTDSSKAPWLLVDDRREFYPWPGTAVSWAYSRLGEFSGTGGASGLLGVRRHNGGLQLRTEFHPTHSLNCDYQNALIVWEGTAPPPGRARTFFLPFPRKDGTAKFLVIAFEVSSGEPLGRSVHPNGSHISRNGQTVLLHDDNVDVHYAIFCEGNHLNSGGGLNSSTTNPRAWKENHSIQLENGHTFGYQREVLFPDTLHLNGMEYDLRHGRVLVLHDDGSVEQLKAFPPLSTANNPPALADFIASTRAMNEEPITLKKLLQQLNTAEAQLHDLLRTYAPTETFVAEVRHSVEALQQKIKEQTEHPNVSAATPALLAESPKLQFLAWQDEWRTNERSGAFHADGSAVTDPAELRLLRRIPATGCNDRGTAEGKRNPRFLHLWFSHPLIDQQSLNEVTLLDGAGGKPLQPRDGMRASNAREAEDGNEDRLGWLTHTLSPGYGGSVPSTVTMRLRYALGPWEREQQVAPNENGIIALGNGSQFNSVGQNAEGKAFFAIAVDMKQDAERQFGVVAVTKDGRELKPSGGGTGGGVGEAVHVQRFIFTAPLAEIAHFRLGTRPVRTEEFPNVPLPAEASTSATGQKLSFGPVIERELSANATLANAFLDLDNGTVMSAPKELVDSLRTKSWLNGGSPQTAPVREWMQSSGVDVIALVSNPGDPSELRQVDGVSGVIGEKPSHPGGYTFDTVTVDLLTRQLQMAEVSFAYLKDSERQWGYDPRGVFSFKTREGRIGLLEILEAKPGRVKLRYKLLQNADPSPAKSDGH